MIIDERISMSLADKVDVWLDFLQEQSNDEEGIEYTRLVLEYGCSLVDYHHDIRKPNEANVDMEGIGSAYETGDRLDNETFEFIDAYGAGEQVIYLTNSNIKGVRYIYEQSSKNVHFGWRYGTDVY